MLRILSAMKFFKTLSALLIFFAIIVLGIYLFTPILIMISQYRHGVTPIHYLLPYPAIYPYPISGGSGLYVFHYALDCYGCFCLFAVTGGIDNVFALYSLQIIGQLRALANKMRHFTFKEGYEKHLQELIEVHRILVRSCKTLQTINGPIVLSMMVTTSVILCCLIFQISQVNDDHCIFFVRIYVYIPGVIYCHFRPLQY